MIDQITVFGGAGGCGLGNRITAVCSGYAAAKVRGVPLTVCWKKGRGCRASWEDLFKPPTLFTLVASVPEGALTHREPSYLAKRNKRHFRAIGQRGFTKEYWEAWQQCARSIELREELAIPDVSDFVAVSIRANFKPRAPAGKWWEGITLPDNAFLCSDSMDHFQQALAIAPGAWSLSSPTTNRDMRNRDLSGAQAAARDMMMMARARLILAIGHRSTLRNFAAIGYGVPVFKMNHSPNP